MLKQKRTSASSRLTSHSRKEANPTASFVELLADSIAADCLIEVEGTGGARLRIQMRMSAPEVLSLVRDWRERSASAGWEKDE